MVRLFFLFLLLVPGKHFGQYIFPLADSLNRFAAEIVMAECSKGVCNGAGYVKISEKAGGVFLQSIHFKSQLLLYPAEMQLKEGEPAAGYKRAPVHFWDLNFDDFSDLVLGSAETTVFYLYRQHEKRFILQPISSRLKGVMITGIGMDTVTKRLVIRYLDADRKIRDEYEWKGNTPQRVFSLTVRERAEGFTPADQRIHLPLPPIAKASKKPAQVEKESNRRRDKQKRHLIVHIVVKEELENGRWKKTSRRFTPEEYSLPEAAAWRL